MYARLIIDDDIPAILNMAADHVAEVMQHQEYDKDVLMGTIRSAIDTGYPLFIAAVNDQKEVVGYLIASWGPLWAAKGLHCSQEVVYIRPQSRGGRALLALFGLFEAHAKGIGATEVYAGVSHTADPERSLRSIEKLGYERSGALLRKIDRERDVQIQRS